MKNPGVVGAHTIVNPLPLMFIGKLREAAVNIDPMTQAAPPMSPLILSISLGGFKEIPPASKVIPLPAK